MPKEIYKGIFLTPSVSFLDTFSDKDDSTEEYWNEVGNILDIADCIIRAV